MGSRFAPLALVVLFGCSNGERPETFAEACLVPGSEGIEGEARPAGGDVWVSADLPPESRAAVEAGFASWAEATGGEVSWRVMVDETGAIRYGALNVFACPEGAPRLTDLKGRRAGSAISGDALALSSGWLARPELQALAAHEAGHAIGLDDSPRPDAVMNPYLPVPGPTDADVAALAAR